MSIKIASLRSDERSKETEYQNWYLPKKGWIVLRAKNKSVANKIVYAMKAACDNNNIIYDKNNRSSLYNVLKSLEFDPSNCTEKASADSSSLIRVCCCYALNTDIKDFNTSTEKDVLYSTGAFDVLTDDKYTTKPDNLLAGDILVTKISGHTAVVLNNTNSNNKIRVASYTLKKGNKGNNVKTLQENLNFIMNSNIEVNGDFDSKTEDILRLFQTKHNIKATGIYDKNTYNVMKSLCNS